jgi:NADH:ubiquinone oxidoreductase subunit K
MKRLIPIGGILIFLGILGLLLGKELLSILPVISGIILAAGLALTVAGTRKAH